MSYWPSMAEAVGFIGAVGALVALFFGLRKGAKTAYEGTSPHTPYDESAQLIRVGKQIEARNEELVDQMNRANRTLTRIEQHSESLPSIYREIHAIREGRSKD